MTESVERIDVDKLQKPLTSAIVGLRVLARQNLASLQDSRLFCLCEDQTAFLLIILALSREQKGKNEKINIFFTEHLVNSGACNALHGTGKDSDRRGAA